ncbi:hypothetical protein [Rossellomorea sp. RS05]|uniref:hypothetical protein n=1 Tax=Rossellomorea sp. RS05 TaxID=3149166 RepID=UPI001C44C307|nr:hypothetical protein [Bacillus sp. JRC01]
MRKWVERLIYFVFTFFIFRVFLYVFQYTFEKWVPLTPEWDVITVFILLPFMIIASFIISAFAFRYAFDRRNA